jgi:hypothetical protein
MRLEPLLWSSCGSWVLLAVGVHVVYWEIIVSRFIYKKVEKKKNT